MRRSLPLLIAALSLTAGACSSEDTFPRDEFVRQVVAGGVTKDVANEKVAFDTIEKDDASMVQGTTAVDRAGVEGRRNVTYKLTYKNGKRS